MERSTRCCHQTPLPRAAPSASLGTSNQAQRPDEGGGQAEHGQGHAAQHAEGAHGPPRPPPPRGPAAGGCEHRGGRAHQVAQQAGQPDGDSDGGDAAVELPVLQRRAGQAARPVQMPPGQQEQGNGENTASHRIMPVTNQPHRPLRVLGEKDHQQPQHRSGADELFTTAPPPPADGCCPCIEEVLVQVFHPGEQDAGQQEQQAQLGAGRPPADRPRWGRRAGPPPQPPPQRGGETPPGSGGAPGRWRSRLPLA